MTLSEPVDRGRAEVTLLARGYDDPVVLGLVAEVQQVYVARYGSPDATPVDPMQFTPPHGYFVVGYLDGEAAAMGGWRLRTGADAADVPGARPAEIKRMYVREHLRGRGLARAVLAELESTARTAGADWLVLETGRRQPEAISLYESSGYTPIAGFGVYAHEDAVVNLGKPLLSHDRVQGGP